MSISVTRRRETRPNHIRKSRSDRVFDAVIYTVAALLTLIALYPMYFIVIASVSDPNLVARGDVLLWPRGVSLEGYSYLFSMSNLWTGYGNTVLYTLAGTLIMLIVNIPVAYALSRKDLPGRGFFTFYFIFPMFFGGGLIPTFIILNNTFHMLDSFLVMVLPFSVISYYIIVARTFFQTSLPGELWDAAQIDGCSNLRYFFRIVLPLSKAILAVIALWAAVGHWNSYFGAMIYMSGAREKWPLQVLLREIIILSNASAGDMAAMDPEFVQPPEQSIKMAVIVVSTVPIMCVYPFLQKYFVKGVMVGALKG